MNSLGFLDIANVNTQVPMPAYELPVEERMHHKLVENFKINQFRANVRTEVPLNLVFPRPRMQVEELNLKADKTVFINVWNLYKGGFVWPPVQASEEETGDPTQEPTVDPTPAPETPVEPTPEPTPEPETQTEP